MWGTSLSGPLLIVGLVGFYPANYLIRRMTILNHLSTFNIKACTPMCYEVLILLSQGYPSV